MIGSVSVGGSINPTSLSSYMTLKVVMRVQVGTHYILSVQVTSSRSSFFIKDRNDQKTASPDSLDSKQPLTKVHRANAP